MNADGCNSAGCTGSVVVSLGDGRFFDGEKTLSRSICKFCNKDDKSYGNS